MRKIAVINLKGGVGKTTTALNIGTGLARKNRRVLLIDLDPQANLTNSLFLRGDKTIYDLLINKAHPAEAIIHLSDFLDVIIADRKLAEAEMIMAGMPSRETILKRALEPVFNYDYVIIDCPPSNGLLNYNALLYADEAFVPVSTDYLGILGLRKVIEIIEEINDLFDHGVEISTIIPTMYDMRSKICKESLEEIKKGFNGEVVPPIRINSKLKETPRAGLSIFEYAKRSRGAEDYSRLVDHILGREEFY